MLGTTLRMRNATIGRNYFNYCRIKCEATKLQVPCVARPTRGARCNSNWIMSSYLRRKCCMFNAQKTPNNFEPKNSLENFGKLKIPKTKFARKFAERISLLHQRLRKFSRCINDDDNDDNDIMIMIADSRIPEADSR